MSSAVKLMLSSFSACSISFLFRSTRLSIASWSSWLRKHYMKAVLRGGSCEKKQKKLRDSRCCLVLLMNPAELEVDVGFDQHRLPRVKILVDLLQQLFLCTATELTSLFLTLPYGSLLKKTTHRRQEHPGRACWRCPPPCSVKNPGRPPKTNCSGCPGESVWR